MKKQLAILAGSAAGAGMMYLFDPVMGRRRRALARDKVNHFFHLTGHAAGITARDVANRGQGLIAKTLSAVRREQVPDEILLGRIRAALGRVVSHPSAIFVTTDDGRVTLSGPVLAREEKRLIRAVRGASGVVSVENKLEPHQTAADIPALQGGTVRQHRSELMQQNWAPATRLATMTVGGALAAFGVSRRDIPGIVAAGAGTALFVRGATNLEMARLFGIRAGRRAVDLVKTIKISAPVERVYAMWSEYENFPFVMSSVQEVRDLGDGRSHWVVRGPAGIGVDWDARVTQTIPNKVLAWKTEPGSLIEHAGIIHFDPIDAGSTRVHIQLSYNPPAGAAGHAIAKLLGSDPKAEMDADLARLKTFIETGVSPRDAAGKKVG